MAQNTVRAKLILRNDSAAEWASKNPVLAKGELGAEIDTGLLKIGDGTTAFNSLNYINGGKAGDGVLITTNNSNQLTVANFGKSYWRYDQSEDEEVQVNETNLANWPSVVELQVKNGVARWVQPKITYDPFKGTISGALITLERDPEDNNEAATKYYVDHTIDVKVANQIANAGHLKREVVTDLPTSNIKENTIYMQKDNNAIGDQYREYLLIDGSLVQIGDTSVNLTNYIQKISSPTAGNLVTVAADGSLVDSGIAAENVGGALNIATTTTLGGVYSSNLENHVAVSNLGYMEVNPITGQNKIATNALYVRQGDEFILDGGRA